MVDNKGGKERGLLVTLEGLSATGKTSTLPLVAELLTGQGIDVLSIPEFSEYPTGNFIREILSGSQFVKFSRDNPSAFSTTMLVIADLYFQDENQIRPALDQGRIVLKERHIDTIFAYEIPKLRNDYPRELFEDLYHLIETATSRLTLPDVTYLLTLPEHVQQQRLLARHGGSIAPGSTGFERKVRGVYELLAAEQRERIRSVSTDKDIFHVAETIAKDISARMYNP